MYTASLGRIAEQIQRFELKAICFNTPKLNLFQLFPFFSPSSSLSLLRGIKYFCWFKHFFSALTAWLPPFMFIKNFRDSYTVRFLEFTFLWIFRRLFLKKDMLTFKWKSSAVLEDNILFSLTASVVKLFVKLWLPHVLLFFSLVTLFH